MDLEVGLERMIQRGREKEKEEGEEKEEKKEKEEVKEKDEEKIEEDEEMEKEKGGKGGKERGCRRRHTRAQRHSDHICLPDVKRKKK